MNCQNEYKRSDQEPHFVTGNEPGIKTFQLYFELFVFCNEAQSSVSILYSTCSVSTSNISLFEVPK